MSPLNGKARGFIFDAEPEFWSLVNDNINITNKDKVITYNSVDLNTKGSQIVFQSGTYRREEPEYWFTKTHIHDYEAV